VLSAAILAGGDSTRMRSPKAVLRDVAGVPFVNRIVASFYAAALADVLIVTGRHHEEVAAAVAEFTGPARPRLVRNPDPSRGQLSSLWVALDACDPRTEALVVTLVDVPFLAVSTITAVVRAWERTRAPIVRPETNGRRGHPVIFDRAVFDELRQAPLEIGARAVVNAHSSEIVNQPVDDPGCIVDIDTPEEYRAAVGRDTEP
jgi:molybdenum cofactor cytidylyltransferase